jgi:hypothetical protein
MEHLEHFFRQSSLFPVFVMATDSTNEISREKIAKVRAVVKRRFNATDQTHPASMLEMGFPESVVPTVSVVAFEFPRGRKTEIEDALQSVLYKPSKNAKNPKFRLAVHGALFA